MILVSDKAASGWLGEAKQRETMMAMGHNMRTSLTSSVFLARG